LKAFWAESEELDLQIFKFSLFKYPGFSGTLKSQDVLTFLTIYTLPGSMIPKIQKTEVSRNIA
jgi:hypothetical protein